VESVPGQGATFTVTLPWGSSGPLRGNGADETIVSDA
jgi:hypothetical protein